jgi:hypothetical protein
MDGKTMLCHNRRHLSIAERKAQVPPHTKKNNLAFVMSPKERIGVIGITLRYRSGSSFSHTTLHPDRRTMPGIAAESEGSRQRSAGARL